MYPHFGPQVCSVRCSACISTLVSTRYALFPSSHAGILIICAVSLTAAYVSSSLNLGCVWRVASACCLIRYPHSRIVCFTQDMVDTILDLYTCRPIDLPYLRKYADLLISYDTTDARQYDMLYHPTVYSPLHIAEKDQRPLYDLYFLGRDKGRLSQLIEICHEATRRGLRCHFLMLEVPKRDQIACEGITYLKRALPYAENLRLCAQSRCIVEMLQQHAASATFRTWETIMLNRKLLTNNVSIATSDFYDSRYISVFDSPAHIDWRFVQSETAFPDGNNPYQQRIRPLSLIHFLEQQLNIHIAHS